MAGALALAPGHPAWGAGLRAAVATVSPLVLARPLGLGGASWLMLAGFIGAVSDKGGPRRARATAIGAVTVAGAIAVALGTLAGLRLYVAVPMTLLFATACGLARIEGNIGTSISVSALNTFVIALALPSAHPREALSRAGYVLLGGAWSMLLALGLWPLRPFRPVRLAVAACFRALADYAATVAESVAGERAPSGREPMAGSPTVRAAIESAGEALAVLRRGRAGESPRGERLLVLREIADQLFGTLIGLADLLLSVPPHRRDPAAQAAVAGALGALAATAREVADAIEEETGSPRIDVAWSGAHLRAQGATDPETDPYSEAALLLDRLARYAANAAENAALLNEERPRPETGPEPAADLPERAPLGARLRAALSPDSVLLRHALRVAIVAAVAVALTGAFGLKRGYWVTITIVIILQPYAGETGQKALQRIAGTVLGGLLTVALGTLFHAPGAILVLTFVFTAVCVALLPLNYVVYSIFLTPTFVLLAEASEGDWGLAWVRVLNTLLGGALALMGARLLWPHPERRRLPAFMAQAVRVDREYLLTTVRLFGDRSDAAGRELRRVRRDLALALSNAEESFQRLLAEHRGPALELAPYMAFLTYTRRLGASIAALALSRHSVGDVSPSVLRPFADAAAGVLADLAGAVGDGRAPAPPPARALTLRSERAPLPLVARMERIAVLLETLHGAATRITARAPAEEAPPTAAGEAA